MGTEFNIDRHRGWKGPSQWFGRCKQWTASKAEGLVAMLPGVGGARHDCDKNSPLATPSEPQADCSHRRHPLHSPSCAPPFTRLHLCTTIDTDSAFMPHRTNEPTRTFMSPDASGMSHCSNPHFRKGSRQRNMSPSERAGRVLLREVPPEKLHFSSSCEEVPQDSKKKSRGHRGRSAQRASSKQRRAASQAAVRNPSSPPTCGAGPVHHLVSLSATPFSAEGPVGPTPAGNPKTSAITSQGDVITTFTHKRRVRRSASKARPSEDAQATAAVAAEQRVGGAEGGRSRAASQPPQARSPTPPPSRIPKPPGLCKTKGEAPKLGCGAAASSALNPSAARATCQAVTSGLASQASQPSDSLGLHVTFPPCPGTSAGPVTHAAGAGATSSWQGGDGDGDVPQANAAFAAAAAAATRTPTSTCASSPSLQLQSVASFAPASMLSTGNPPTPVTTHTMASDAPTARDSSPAPALRSMHQTLKLRTVSDGRGGATDDPEAPAGGTTSSMVGSSDAIAVPAQPMRRQQSAGTTPSSLAASGRVGPSRSFDGQEDKIQLKTESQQLRRQISGFGVNSVDASCSADAWEMMTNDVDFGAVSQGLSHAWFLRGARKLSERQLPRPAASHGISGMLAKVHRTKPQLACARRAKSASAGVGALLCIAVSYESVGVWRDSEGQACLVIRARFGDGGKKMLLLYESGCMEVRKRADVRKLPVCSEGQWCIIRE